MDRASRRQLCRRGPGDPGGQQVGHELAMHSEGKEGQEHPGALG